MSMYWIYDIPNWQLAVLIIGVFVAFALVGFAASRPLVRRLLNGSPAHNDIVSFFFAGIGVFYGLAMGLIAVATWEDYSDVDGMVSQEAAALAGLYRDLDCYPQPFRRAVEDRLRDYTRFILDKAWPAHQKGEAPEGGTVALDELKDQVLEFEPKSERDKIAHAQVLASLDGVIANQRLRLESVGTALPMSLWAVLLVGAALTIAFTYLFWVENVRLHAVLVAMLATFIGLLIFLTAAMDNPYRGEFSVSSDAFRVVLDNVMKPTATGSPTP
jgi:hypothetical protein